MRVEIETQVGWVKIISQDVGISPTAYDLGEIAEDDDIMLGSCGWGRPELAEV